MASLAGVYVASGQTFSTSCSEARERTGQDTPFSFTVHDQRDATTISRRLLFCGRSRFPFDTTHRSLVERRGRLVQQQCLGSIRQRPRHGNPLRFSGRQRDHAAILICRQADAFEQRSDLVFRNLLTGVAAGQTRCLWLLFRETGRQFESPCRRGGAARAVVVTVEQYRAACRLVEAVDKP